LKIGKVSERLKLKARLAIDLPWKRLKIDLSGLAATLMRPLQNEDSILINLYTRR
jgi:hypothetical protein